MFFYFEEASKVFRSYVDFVFFAYSLDQNGLK